MRPDLPALQELIRSLREAADATERQRIDPLASSLMEIAASHLERMGRENESLRAECGVRQIAGYQKGRAETIEECAKACYPSAQQLKLQIGECSAAEMRAIRAALNVAASIIRALAPRTGAGEEK